MNNFELILEVGFYEDDESEPTETTTRSLIIEAGNETTAKKIGKALEGEGTGKEKNEFYNRLISVTKTEKSVTGIPDVNVWNRVISKTGLFGKNGHGAPTV